MGAKGQSVCVCVCVHMCSYLLTSCSCCGGCSDDQHDTKPAANSSRAVPGCTCKSTHIQDMGRLRWRICVRVCPRAHACVYTEEA